MRYLTYNPSYATKRSQTSTRYEQRSDTKMQEVISETLVDAIPKDGLFDILLHYGLFLGALFQLVCIFAVTFVPASDDENVSSSLLTSTRLESSSGSCLSLTLTVTLSDSVRLSL